MQFAFQEEKNPQEIEQLTRESMINFFRNYLELFFFTGPHRDQLLKRITIEGREYLDLILSQSRGIIAVSAHLNNFALMVLKLSYEGYPISIAVKDLKGAAQSRIYARCRKDLLNLNSILTQPSSRFSREVMKHLKGNGIICLIADENKRHGGVFVNFFGRPASTATGPAYLMLKTGTPVVPIFMVRRRDNSQKIVIEPPLNYELSGNNERDIETITLQFTRTIESYIRKYPGQWRWDHFRWKTQPFKERDTKKPSQLSLFNGRIMSN